MRCLGLKPIVALRFVFPLPLSSHGRPSVGRPAGTRMGSLALNRWWLFCTNGLAPTPEAAGGLRRHGGRQERDVNSLLDLVVLAFADVKSKLVVWLVMAAMMLAVQCRALPFDVRATGLADRAEIIGLMACFASLLLVTLAFLCGSPPCSA